MISIHFLGKFIINGQLRGRIPYPQNQYHHTQSAAGLGNDIICGKDKSYYGIYQKPILKTIVSDVYIE